MEMKDLTLEQLVQLRADIKLGSCFVKDYVNSLDIDPVKVADFFNGYDEYLFELAEGDPNFSGDPKDVVDVRYEYDNNKTLIRYFNSLEW